jgi:hypothetical protein
VSSWCHMRVGTEGRRLFCFKRWIDLQLLAVAPFNLCVADCDMAASNRAGLMVLAGAAAVVTFALVAMSAVIASADSYGSHVYSPASRTQELRAASTQDLAADPTPTQTQATQSQAVAQKVANLGLAGSLLSPKCRSRPPTGVLFGAPESSTRFLLQRCIGVNGQGDERVAVQ